jgi:hypothetical protein
MYLEAEIAAGADALNGNGTTKQRLSTIEMTMIAGVLISAISLTLNIYNTMKKAAAT